MRLGYHSSHCSLFLLTSDAPLTAEQEHVFLKKRNNSNNYLHEFQSSLQISPDHGESSCSVKVPKFLFRFFVLATNSFATFTSRKWCCGCSAETQDQSAFATSLL